MQTLTAPNTDAVPARAMAVACGIAVSSIYFNQPMLGLLEQAFPGSRLAGMIPTVTQLGFAAGLFFVVPLGDLMERRRLIVAQFGLLAIALGLAAAAPGLGFLLLASALVGMGATVAQQIVPFAAHLAPAERRGAVVGTVMAGLLAGILLSRTAAGAVADLYGWRAIFALAVPVSLLAGAMMARILPESRPDGRMTYGSLLGSLTGLWHDFPTLRRAAFTQALQFASFSVFWTTLALLLQSPRFNLGSAYAGAFGVIGLVGVLAAPLAGRAADRIGPERVVAMGAVVSLAAWLVFGLWLSLAGLVLGVVLLDFGAQVSMVSNQSIIYALRPEARSRLNTVFMTIMFLGGALGSAAATVAWQLGGWGAVSILGVTLGLAASALQGLALRRKTPT